MCAQDQNGYWGTLLDYLRGSIEELKHNKSLYGECEYMEVVIWKCFSVRSWLVKIFFFCDISLSALYI